MVLWRPDLAKTDRMELVAAVVVDVVVVVVAGFERQTEIEQTS